MNSRRLSPSSLLAFFIFILAIISFISGLFEIATLIGFALIILFIADLIFIYKAPTIEIDSEFLITRKSSRVFTITLKDIPPIKSKISIKQQGNAFVCVEPIALKPNELTIKISSEKRGIFKLPPTFVLMVGPMRLCKIYHIYKHGSVVKVHGDLPGAKKYLEARRKGVERAQEGRLRSRFGLGTDFDSLNDYSPDDDVRQINWLATIRAGKPISNQYRIDENRTIYCLLDAGRLMLSNLEGSSRFDILVDAMTWLLVATEDANDSAGLIVFSNRIMQVIRPSHKNAIRCVTAATQIIPEPTNSDLELAVQLALGFKSDLIVIFTDLVDEYAGFLTLESLRSLKYRNKLMFVTAKDTELESLQKRFPKHELEVTEQAISTDLLSSRSRLINQMRKHQVAVIEDSPKNLAKTTVNEYFRLKARNLL